MKTFKFSLVLRTRENTDVFITLDDNIYGIHSQRVNILFLIMFSGFTEPTPKVHIGFALFIRQKELHHFISLVNLIATTYHLTLLLLNMTGPVLANRVDPEQLASSEAKWSGSALFVIKYVNFYQKPGSIWFAEILKRAVAS